jgi:4-hydroxybenzoate polyprenyltransferase
MIIPLKLNQYIPEKYQPYLQLMRVDKPIGIYLLLWPTMWALFVGAKGIPPVSLIVIFGLGVFLMRSAGCVINDYADRDIDSHVERTQSRPLALGLVTPKQALQLFSGLIICAAFLLIFLPLKTFWLSIVAVLIASAYPFMKRYTYFPQVVLGIAFAWSIPMAYSALEVPLDKSCWLLFIATVIWTVAYDTMYAMVDREDDIKIGVRSTAIFLGHSDIAAIRIMQLMMLSALILLGIQQEYNIAYYLGLFVVFGLIAHQIALLKQRHSSMYFKAFLNNHILGSVVFVSIASHYLVEYLKSVFA